ncbi:anthranilate synthase component I family protein [Vitreimonas flagellata]|uniref:anthranilate synthase component I family protein n=1 Tax=Vitreimonas flagellata TaxID=2560861 RepID=UPI001EF8E16C|nr:anthranilate synthase component I family protein [Vitreimonas flagellata]
MKPYVHEIEYRDPIDACAPLRDTPMTLLLHGACSRWSYIAADPIETISASADDGRVTFARARKWIAEASAGDASPDLPPFAGGVAGLVGYEMARAFDTAPHFSAPDGTPDLALGLYDCIAAFDHDQRRACVVAWSANTGRAQDRATHFAHRLGSARVDRSDAIGVLKSQTSLSDYEAMVAKIVARVHAGDLYQANISRRYAGALAAGDHPYSLFARLVTQSPAPFAAYMRLTDHALVSNSPERFLSASRRDNGQLFAFSQPIKGTRPRGANAAEDEANARALLASAKDRAENLMIVDLMRNDLSKTCVPGSVRVPRLCGLESYANVHHLVSDIEGRLREDADAFELFAGAFPPGSITGAPKLKAMELIGALEGAGRGPYCGSLVWFGFNGAMDSSVLIRTATCARRGVDWRVAFNVGAGIVAESDPLEEARETVTKAASLRRAITGHVGGEA